MCNFNDADCQSICFGSVSQHDMIHLAGSFVMQKHEVNQDSKHDTNQDPRLLPREPFWRVFASFCEFLQFFAMQYDGNKEKAKRVSR
ncbi:hypothetical protein TGAM01_v206926 [Trichoderma gamsii]|uniref:Uncharacterized protein n=1 Tax=Trichoderma gamsii TaxID=398673 RepID=A0A2P4ZIX5_9HYPO|nr:hypothetical protein TGAM01_v206926 [Trichoderma gamsii]PON24238.1 hypothetical protein TGAM01_v206926 [Trichoderma gamsii]